MVEYHSKQISPEYESRYHQLRDAVADYHYHVLLDEGQVVEKQHGPKCAAITGYRPEEYALLFITTYQTFSREFSRPG
ncbi:hypothetical protein FYZ48_25695 [Gimesia chilikensis]|uniref:hypothetical protein n=1 Tax=Gimesia chilikensis TaxID=2605989 RepID=UPI0011ED1DD5|nr:hypothetical protein [Gimesia chilikensis]KAA0131539.1 hypothetical protein FYZ48_25695 [Gimesia chilikensis]